MAKRRISFLIIPPDNDKVRNYSVSQASLYMIVGIIAVFLLVSGIWGFSFFKYQFDRAELNNLKQENEFLVQRIAEMDHAVSIVKDRIEQIIEKDNNIRMAFDIPQVDSETRKLGVGGTFEPESIPVKKEVAYDLHTVQNDIQTLLRTTEFENSSYAAVLDEVVSKKHILDHTPSIRPTEGYLSSGYGMRPDPFTGEVCMHTGIDIAGEKGTPVLCTADGVIKHTGWVGRFGKIIIVDHGFGHKSVYGHLDEINVRKGQSVKRWQVIGTMGSTGRSTGPHLHYEVHKNN
ncbi:MAG: peptidoglycan DD-metalloendopeptidase family protein, partial [candidate division Zixibacteria bacterium]|nr:peptidoglycan DD-metalloendopeptidase family protein [candidate division Zixibacteria bacterium]